MHVTAILQAFIFRVSLQANEVIASFARVFTLKAWIIEFSKMMQKCNLCRFQ